jgi:heme-degrading monooxygenase HmoA
MIAVISEVVPHADRKPDYFMLTQELQPHLHAVDGFISSERFESCKEPGKYLSVSYWRDEAALLRWRNLDEHRKVMAMGRNNILRDYHIRITEVLREYGMNSRAGAPLE